MAKKRRKKKAVRRAAPRTPTLGDAMRAVQAFKSRKGLTDEQWHMLSTVEGSLRKLGA